ncbi:MAG: phosphate ABC transporter substrate-binding protein [Verrucomicrobiales bacterium]|nr:phosphate ABC transporter substrate-binding protein [Verrucomicrobiales bacterium]MCP5527831.1 phosphate ABC transporter substrate-binding protein [Verrucomicrobiales bacterium]
MVLVALSGCGPSGDRGSGGESGPGKTVVSVQGSDTMVNEAQAWAEAYAAVAPEVSVEVGGGGSGVGIAALIAGTIDIANASRDMKDSERAKAKANTGRDAVEFVVGYDALAVYVHRDNPLEEITLEQLAAIYAESGTTTKWADLGVTVPGCAGEILRVSRQSNSGTYEFFREHVLAKHDFKLGSTDLNGSKEVVEMVGNTPCAIGYSGMGYATDKVKMLRIALKAGEPAYVPSVDNALSKKYPIARPLYLYTLGQPEGAVKQYIDWILGPAGQKIVAESGYVPLPAKAAP